LPHAWWEHEFCAETRPLHDGSASGLRAIDAQEPVNLSHDQSRRLGLRFFKFYNARVHEALEGIIVGTRVGIMLNGRRQYGNVLTINSTNASVELDGNGAKVVSVRSELLLRRRTRLSPTLKKKWVRELGILGGPAAVASAYSAWVKDLEKLLIVARNKGAVLASLARSEKINRDNVKAVCNELRIPGPIAASALFYDHFFHNQAGDDILFKRQRGKAEVYVWKDMATRRRFQVPEPLSPTGMLD
jgi:hypothetical protein